MLWKTISDGRGKTYVAELPKPIKVAYDGYATHVCKWFNHTTRDWVVSYSNATGAQMGDSQYCGYREWADDEAEGLYTAALTADRHPFELRPGSVSKCLTCGRSRTYGDH